MLPPLKSLTAVTIGGLLLIAIQSAGAQTETVLYTFCSRTHCADGGAPGAGVIVDKNGNLYGTTVGGGANNYGTVFEISASGVETVLHSFNENGTDGYGPNTSLVMDEKGDLYGTTGAGGKHGSGTVFEVSAAGVETVLYSFNPDNERDGALPYAGLVLDKMGNLYGTNVNNGCMATARSLRSALVALRRSFIASGAGAGMESIPLTG